MASKYLGEPFELNGKVMKGDQIGRTIGYPTANLDLEDKLKIIPKDGIYAVEIAFENGEIHKGMMSIGKRPTVSSEKKTTLEVHIFDFKGNLYGNYISVRLLSRFRDEFHFQTIDKLKKQIEQDEKDIRHFFNAKS